MKNKYQFPKQVHTVSTEFRKSKDKYTTFVRLHFRFNTTFFRSDAMMKEGSYFFMNQKIYIANLKKSQRSIYNFTFYFISISLPRFFFKFCCLKIPIFLSKFLAKSRHMTFVRMTQQTSQFLSLPSSPTFSNFLKFFSTSQYK